MTDKSVKSICIIPARGGSKGVPGKNLAKINGISLTKRAVQCAIETETFEMILVSTDDKNIAKEALEAGAEVPFIRPQKLANDTSPVIDTILHACRSLKLEEKNFDLIALLEPSSPFRTPQIVKSLLNKVVKNSADSGQTLSLVPDNFRPTKQMVFTSAELTKPVLLSPPEIFRRQDLEKSYIRNGLGYVMTIQCAMKLRKIIGPKNVGVVIEEEVVNIDWPEDLAKAKRLLEKPSG